MESSSIERDVAALAEAVGRLEALGAAPRRGDPEWERAVRGANASAQRLREAVGAALEAREGEVSLAPESRREFLAVSLRRFRVRFQAAAENHGAALRALGASGDALAAADRDALLAGGGGASAARAKRHDEARETEASLKRTRELLEQGLDQMHVAAGAIDDDGDALGGVLGYHGQISGAMRAAKKLIRAIRDREHREFYSMVASVAAFYAVVLFVVWRRLPLREVLRWTFRTLVSLVARPAADPDRGPDPPPPAAPPLDDAALAPLPADAAADAAARAAADAVARAADVLASACAAAIASGLQVPAHCAAHATTQTTTPALEGRAATAARTPPKPPPPPLKNRPAKPAGGDDPPALTVLPPRQEL